MRSSAKVGETATSRRPPWPRARTSGRPATGAEMPPSGATRRRRPGRSVTRSPPSGRRATPQGCSRGAAMVSTASSKPERVAGARVCSAKAGWKLGTLGVPCSTGSGDWAPAAQARRVVEATRPARRGMAALLVGGSAMSTGRRGQRSVTGGARRGRPAAGPAGGSGEVEAVGVHHLGPGGDEVVRRTSRRVVGCA